MRCCSDERLDAQPARRSTENIKTKVVVLTVREEFPNAPTPCWHGTTYVIMATKTGPHAVSTILPIA